MAKKWTVLIRDGSGAAIPVNVGIRITNPDKAPRTIVVAGKNYEFNSILYPFMQRKFSYCLYVPLKSAKGRIIKGAKTVPKNILEVFRPRSNDLNADAVV